MADTDNNHRTLFYVAAGIAAYLFATRTCTGKKLVARIMAKPEPDCGCGCSGHDAHEAPPPPAPVETTTAPALPSAPVVAVTAPTQPGVQCITLPCITAPTEGDYGAAPVPDGFVRVDESMCRNTYGGVPDGPAFPCPYGSKPVPGFDG